MSAERLREAAKVLRERAEAASQPWHPWGDKRIPKRETMIEWAQDAHGYLGGTWGEYVATVHPGVGLALADWLDDMTQRHDFGQGWCQHCRQNAVCGEGRKALAVADAILGGAS